jgi:hypothetical protein
MIFLKNLRGLLGPLAAVLIVSEGATAATVEFAGVINDDAAAEISAWKTATISKSQDSDSDNVYGTLAHLFYQIEFKGQNTLYAFNSSDTQVGPFAGYATVDHPDGVSADTQVRTTTSGNIGSGAQDDVMFTFTAIAGSPVNVRIGIVTDCLDGANFSPASIGLRQVGGSSAEHALTSVNNTMDMVFFDVTGITGGDQFQVFADAGSGGFATHSIVTWDELNPIDITDPTSNDGDTMGDNWEEFYFGDTSRDGTGDFDSDGLSDLAEWNNGTNPTVMDSDDDGLTDGQEVNIYTTDPLDNDSDNDGWSDGDEVAAGTNPKNINNFPTVTVPRPVAGSTNTTRDAVVVFNEIHYHSAGDNVALEFIELYNQLAVNVDMSNWRIAGVDYNFPEGTVINARSYLVIAKDPGNYPGALGPFAGTLSNSGETLRLYNNNRALHSNDSNEGRRIMDEITYSDTYPWPIGPDGSGATLTKIDSGKGSAHPNNWTHGKSSPGIANIEAIVPTVVFNEISGAIDFKIELHNFGEIPVTLDGMVIASSNALHSDYTLPAGAIEAGEFMVIDATMLGFTPEDNNRLFLYTPGKTDLIDAARADDQLKARNTDGRWFVPSLATFGNANTFDFEDAIVINEIFYNAYPVRASSGTPPTYANIDIFDFDQVWRYNLDAGAAGLPAGWKDVAHSVDNVSWAQGPGLLGFEGTPIDEPISTTVTLSSKIPYYFETEFTYNDAAEIDQMFFEHYIDDGAVFYLNGIEIARFNMPGGVVTPATAASPGVSDATLQTLTVQAPNILQGVNRLSVEVHQATSGSSDLVFGTRLSLRKITSAGTPDSPYSERDEEWIELYNKSAAAVDLGAWNLDGGVTYDFPVGTLLGAGEYLIVAKDSAALALKFPSATVIGNYSGRLGNGGDRISLEDAVGNPADEATYFDSGKWHAKADGGGSSLELTDPDSDNRVANAWAPSNESARSSWNTYIYEGVAVNDGIGNNVYHEFLIALLDAGEFLLDDVSVLENNSIEMIQNGDFEGDTAGSTADKWRAIGTHGSHGKTVIVDDNGNKCLHVVATGPTEDKHNKVETTFANGEQVTPGATYRISFRAKFLSGSNQVNTRLYFNYLQRTIDISTPEIWGTPGSANSTVVANAGPTLDALAHSPVVPAANQAVNIAIDASDSDGINDLTLFYSINAGAFQTSPMSAGADGRYVGAIPGQSASSIVRFYVRGRDSSNATTLYPAAGSDGGAFYKVQDGLADSSGLRHNFRIVMAEADRTFLFASTNRMSNDRFPVTVIEDESTAYYNCGLRLKASGFGRFNSGHYGFNIEFQPDQLFRGVHSTISIERSPDLKEILAKHLINRAGGTYASFYDDAAFIITPTTGDRGRGLISMARQTSNFFDGLFPNAADSGTLFNQELLYNPNGTSGGAEGLKVGNPYNHTGGRYDLVDRGDDKEPYRWGFQIRSARGRDDYSQIIALNQALGNLSGTALKDALDPLIDVDQWMRTFAMMSLNGTDDIFSRIWEHNFRYFVRPTDGKIIVLQWDLDRSFQLGTNSSITPDRNTVTKLFTIPQFRRLFDGHLDDLVTTTFNNSYVSPWATHFNTIVGASNQTNYVTNRGNFALGTLPASIPFAITTNGGADFAEADSVIDLQGDAWVDVFSIQANGISAQITWTDADSWQLTVPIGNGPNTLTLTAFNNHGIQVGSDTITVTSTSAVDLANATNTIISELHYHPADPSQAEIDAGFIDADMFEFVELMNIGANPIDLTNVAFTDGITFAFPVSTTLAPGQRLILVANQPAFEFRYGAGGVTGQYAGNLRNSGEHIRLEAADTTAIADFTYGETIPWPPSADGGGYSLVFVGDDPTLPLDWRSSTDIGGNPGSTDSIPLTGGDLIAYAIASPLSVALFNGTLVLTFDQNLAADDAEVIVEFSEDLITWTPATTAELASITNQGDGTESLSYQAPATQTRKFARIRVQTR